MSIPIKIQSSFHRQHPDLQLFLLSNQESNKQNQRINLRKNLALSLQNHGHSAPPTLQDLLSLPTHDHLALSLSHCSDYSAFGWCNKPKRLGLDIESLLRLKKETVARVSTNDELLLAPRYELLWSCKESVFKALSPQINVLSFVDIFDWKSLRDDTTQDSWQFSARLTQSSTPLPGHGEVRLILGHVFAFFVLNS